MPERRVIRQVRGRETAEGAGVRLRRTLGGPELDHLDPFLLLDEFRSDNSDDYIAGFPDHPHRGFETVTAGRGLVEPRYQDIASERVPEADLAPGARARVLAGRVGNVAGPVVGVSTSPLYWDVRLEPSAVVSLPIPAGRPRLPGGPARLRIG